MIGSTRWVIADGYIPPTSNGPEPAMTSHDSACLLNASGSEVHVSMTVYFTDREPAGPFLFSIAPRRALHQRFNDLDSPEPLPRDVDYSVLIESDHPIVVQHTRLDSRQAANALMTTVAYSA